MALQALKLLRFTDLKTTVTCSTPQGAEATTVSTSKFTGQRLHIKRSGISIMHTFSKNLSQKYYPTGCHCPEAEGSWCGLAADPHSPGGPLHPSAQLLAQLVSCLAAPHAPPHADASEGCRDVTFVTFFSLKGKNTAVLSNNDKSQSS